MQYLLQSIITACSKLYPYKAFYYCHIMDEEFISKIGANIAKFREKKGVSQAELAKLINEDIVDVILIENGKKDAGILALYRIGAALKVQSRDFLG